MKPEIFFRSLTEQLTTFFERFPLKSREHQVKHLSNFFAGLREAQAFVDAGDMEGAKALIRYQYEALLKEHVGWPFHSTAFEIDIESYLSEDGLKIRDVLYKDTDILERSLRGVAAAVGSVRQARYTKEADQVERLVNVVGECLESHVSPQALIDAMAETPEPTDVTLEIEERLLAMGWVFGSDQPPRISPEASRSLGVPETTKCVLGPQFFYIMPQSSVHSDFRDSMYVIAQVAYLPEHNRWVLLHDQHMIEHSPDERLFQKKGWQRHHQVLGDLDPEYELLEKHHNAEIHEQQVMAQLVELPHTWRERHPHDIFIELLPNKSAQIDTKERQVELEAHYDELYKNFNLHADYLLSIMAFEKSLAPEELLESEWSLELRERLAVALRQSLTTLLHQELLTIDLIDNWYSIYTNTFSQLENRAQPQKISTQMLVQSAQSAPWLLKKLVSVPECIGLSFAPVLRMANPTLFNAMQTNTLSWPQAIQLWGKDAHEGLCRACHTQTFLGGCDMCGACQAHAELAQESLDNVLKTGGRVPSKSSGGYDKVPSKSYDAGQVFTPTETLSLTALIAGDYVRLN